MLDVGLGPMYEPEPPDEELEEDDELDELDENHHHWALEGEAVMPSKNRHATAKTTNFPIDFFSIKNLPFSAFLNS